MLEQWLNDNASVLPLILSKMPEFYHPVRLVFQVGLQRHPVFAEIAQRCDRRDFLGESGLYI